MKTLLGSTLLVAGLGLLASGVLYAQPVITNQPANQTVLLGGNATFSVLATGTGPFTYQWQLNGTNLPNNIITTVAGNGIYDFYGDGGPAINAALFNPSGVAVDAAGNLFIADNGNERIYRGSVIREVSTNGIITTVAGNGTNSYSGDGGAATNANLHLPTYVTLDIHGNLFIADQINNRVRKVDTNGIITTVAGNGSKIYSADGFAATNASLYNPDGVVVDVSGNVFVADESHNRVRKIDTNGIITTFAGNGGQGYYGDGGAAINASLHSPAGLAMDAMGDLFIADIFNNRIRKVNTNGIITTVAGNGTQSYSGDGGYATNAGIVEPSGVAVDATGNIFIADTFDGRIRQVDTNSIIMTIAGNGAFSYSGDGGRGDQCQF